MRLWGMLYCTLAESPTPSSAKSPLLCFFFFLINLFGVGSEWEENQR